MRHTFPSISSSLLSSFQRLSLLRHPLKRYPPFIARSSSTTPAPEKVNSCFKYRHIEDVEPLERYQRGGYHPILISDVLADRYHVIHKLGYGTYSTIWLARDIQRAAYVAIKICTADASHHEVKILRALAEPQPGDCSDDERAMVPVIHDQFEVQGPNGRHRCYVTSPARSSVAIAQFSSCFPTETARVLAAQLVLAVAKTHSRGFVHGGIVHSRFPK